MKILKHIIFFSGLTLTIFGFFISNTNDYQFVLKIVSPSYVKGMKGIASLKRGDDLLPEMVGFYEIAIPLSKRMLNSETNESIDPCEIVIIKAPTGSAIGISRSGTNSVTNMKAKCKNGYTINTTFESLLKNVEKLKNKNIKWLSLLLFVSGIILSIIGYLVGRKEQA